MTKIKLSISIPYKKRLENLGIVFEALANQTMDSSEFEVIIGAMEYCEEFVALCKKFNNRINIISVLTNKDFSIPQARNLAMRQASGHVVVQMDADTLLPANALQNLYYRHFVFGQEICIVGQVVDYGNNNDGDVERVEILPYSRYQEELIKLETSSGSPRDPRFQVAHIIPWAFGWTGLIALPLATVRKHNLYFDEDFHGWGVDDLEWSYRICNSGTPIVLCEDVRAIHLPHTRNQSANEKTEKRNYQRFLKKWPRIDVELAYTFGDIKANDLFLKYSQELKKIIKTEENRLATVRGKLNGQDILLVGVEINDKEAITNNEVIELFDDYSKKEILPLVGMALPYLDKEICECRVLPSISQLSDLYREKVQEEIERVSKKVIMFNILSNYKS